MMNFSFFFDHSTDLLCIIDRSANFVSLNKQWFNVLGYLPDELTGKPVRTILKNNDLPDILLSDKNTTESDFECICITKSGIEIELNWKIVAKENNLLYLIINYLTSDEKIITESEQKYRLITESMADVVSLLDMNLKVIYVSPSVKNILGYDIEEYSNMPLEKLIIPESLKKVYEIFEDELEIEKRGDADPQRTRIIEMEQIKKDGTKIWMEDNLSFLRDERNIPIGIISVSRDITQNKLLKTNITESENRFKSLFDNMRSGVAVYNVINSGEDFIFQDINIAGQNSSKIKKEDLIGKSVTELFPSVKEMGLFKILQEVNKTGIPQHLPLQLYKDKRIVQWVENFVYKLPSGEIVAIYDDTSEKELAIINMQKVNNKLQSLFDHMINGFAYHKIILDENNRAVDYEFLETNKAFHEMTGLSGDVIGKTIKEVIPGIDKDPTNWIEKYGNVAITGNPVKFESFSIELNKWYQINAYSIEKNYFATIFEDITKIKQSEELLKTSAEKWESTFNSITDTISIISTDHVFLEINKAGCESLGLEKKDIIGRKCYELVHNIHQVYEKCPCVSCLSSKEEGTSVIFENNKYYQVTVWPIKNKEDEVIAFSHSVRDITEARKSEETIKTNYTLLKFAGKTAKFGGWDVDLTNNRSKWSDEVAAIHEMPAGYIPTVSEGINFYAPEWRERITEVVNDCINKGIPYDEEMEILTSGGKRVWIRTIGEAVKDSSGKIIKIQGFFQDINEKKLTEIALKKSEEKYRKLIQNQGEGVGIVDENEVFTFVNPAACRIFGYPENELLGKNLKSFVEEEVWQLFVKQTNNRKKGQENQYEFEIKRGDGSRRILEITATPLTGDKNDYLGSFGIFRDITEKKISENEIKAHNDRIESLLKISFYNSYNIQHFLDFALSEIILLTKSKIGYIYFYNEELKQFTLNTWSKEVMEECEIKNPQTVYDLDKTGCWGDAVRQRGPIIINEYNLSHPQEKGTPKGHIILKNFMTTPVFSDNKIVAVVGVANKSEDYTGSDLKQLNLMMSTVWQLVEKKKIQDELLRQQNELESQNEEYRKLNAELQVAKEKAMESDELKTAFLANMSHEIRTPLNGVIGFAEMLKNPNLTAKDRELYISFINSSGNQLIHIISDIIDIAKIEANQIFFSSDDVELNILAYETYLFFKEGKDGKEKPEIELKMGFNPLERILLKTDSMRLQQVIFNLIRNAYKFTTRGFIEFGYSVKNDFLEFYVKDTGIGIPYDKQDIVFDRFRQVDGSQSRRFGGSGLGLAIAKGLIEKLGGKIWMESVPKTGSTFYFNIPFIISDKHEEKIIEPVVKHEISEKSVILVVEDDFISVQYINEIFRNKNVIVLAAGNGKEAIEQVLQNKDISLVLMDLNMPMMSGYESLNEIKKIRPDLPVIAQTANAMSEDRKNILDYGFDGYIAKPFTYSQLYNLVKSFLGKS